MWIIAIICMICYAFIIGLCILIYFLVKEIEENDISWDANINKACE
jgi:hypothetical protein